MFPDLTFLQLLFGFRPLEALEAAFPDCVVRTQEARLRRRLVAFMKNSGYLDSFAQLRDKESADDDEATATVRLPRGDREA